MPRGLPASQLRRAKVARSRGCSEAALLRPPPLKLTDLPFCLVIVGCWLLVVVAVAVAVALDRHYSYRIDQLDFVVVVVVDNDDDMAHNIVVVVVVVAAAAVLAAFAHPSSLPFD